MVSPESYSFKSPNIALRRRSVLMLKRVLEEKDSKAILVLPYVALVQEKVRWLRNLAAGLTKHVDPAGENDDKRIWQRRADENTVRVVGFFGGGKIRATWADFDIGVCTIEKARIPLLHLLPTQTLEADQVQ